MRSLIIYLFIIFPFSNVLAQVCIGPTEAKHFVIYFHGMDTKLPNSQELKNRVTLERLARKLDLRIALPRAKEECPNDEKQTCWGWNFNDPSVINSSLKTAHKTAKKCFKRPNNIILLGFSNGGFVINRIFQDCIKTPYSKFISIAASGTWDTNSTRDLSKCGHLEILIGSKDFHNNKTVKEYNSWLIKNKANTTLLEFDGGHELPSKDLERVLKKLIQ